MICQIFIIFFRRKICLELSKKQLCTVVLGHLAIEAVEDGYVYFTEDNWAADDPALKRMTVSEFTSNRQVIGYIAV